MKLFGRTSTANVRFPDAAAAAGLPQLRPNPRTLAQLATHMDIGWDFDGTLVGHPASPMLHEFVRTHRAIRHVIVTFRTYDRGSIWPELATYKGAPDRACFDGILNIPDEAMTDLLAARQRLGFVRHFLPHSVAEQRFRRWKGQICQERGLTALVDDMTAHVASGCRRHAVALFHPADFLAD